MASAANSPALNEEGGVDPQGTDEMFHHVH